MFDCNSYVTWEMVKTVLIMCQGLFFYIELNFDFTRMSLRFLWRIVATKGGLGHIFLNLLSFSMRPHLYFSIFDIWFLFGVNSAEKIRFLVSFLVLFWLLLRTSDWVSDRTLSNCSLMRFFGYFLQVRTNSRCDNAF